MIKEVAFIAIAVSDKDKAQKFYQETLELKPSRTQMDGGWVEYDLGDTTIGVGCHPAWNPSRDGTTVAFEVDGFTRGSTCNTRRTSPPALRPVKGARTWPLNRRSCPPWPERALKAAATSPSSSSPPPVPPTLSWKPSSRASN